MKKRKLNSHTINEELPVAIYVRMSTDHQRYSIINQTSEILKYANKNKMKVVRTYADKGKSGLNIKGRKGLTSLIENVESKDVIFKAILVYDVSRWGRFQDADESAYYEFLCKKAGIKVHYCAEPFINDDSSFSTIVKNLKRAMAGEFSRELSVKIFNAQCRLVRNGFKPGGGAGYGFRRLLIDENGKPKQMLKVGERKNLKNDRVILVPGPKNEIETIKLIFDLYATGQYSVHQIVKQLNANLEITGRGKPWRIGNVVHILKNEKYIGNNVYNRKSAKLKGRSRPNPPEEWVRAKNVIEPLVSKSVFYTTQKILKSRGQSLTDEEMLDGLAKLYKRKGYLNYNLINKDKKTPRANTYEERFKSLYTAYALVGFHHNHHGKSSEEMLIKLKELYLKHGYLSTRLIFGSKDMPSVSTYANRFGTVTEAYKLVGFTSGSFLIPPKVMLSKLKQLYNQKKTLTEDIVNKSKLVPRASVYRRAFGSLKTAYKLIGFDPELDRVSNGELLENLKEIIKLNGYLSGPLIDKSEFYGKRQLYSRRFGSLTKAYGLVGYKQGTCWLQNDQMLSKLRQLLIEKKQLSAKIINNCKYVPSTSTYVNHFGDLKNLYELVGFTPNKRYFHN